MLAGKCSQPYWLTVSIMVPETKQSESWSCSSGIGTHTQAHEYPTLPSAQAPQPVQRRQRSCPDFHPQLLVFVQGLKASFHVFAAFCILLFFYSGLLFPSFSNYLPNKSHSLIDTSTETPKAQERIRCKVHEPEVCIRWICSWGRNYPLLLQCVCLHILRSTKPTS